MTTPAITQLLEQHRAIVESRVLSFDEKVGWLTHALLWNPALTRIAGLEPSDHLSKPLSAIREALTANQSRRLSEAARRVAEHEAKANAERAEVQSHERIKIKANQTSADLHAERRAITNITKMDLNDPIVVENLQLHVKRLAALQRKAHDPNQTQTHKRSSL